MLSPGRAAGGTAATVRRTQQCLSHLRRALTRRGRLVIVGGETDGRWLGGFDRQLRAIMLSPVVSQKLGILGAKENSADLSVLRELLEAGKVIPAVDRTYPLSETAAAIRYFQQGQARGKVVIAVQSQARRRSRYPDSVIGE